MYLASAAKVSQGSIVTCLKGGGKYIKHHAKNLLQNPAVKEFRKSVDICQSYAEE